MSVIRLFITGLILSAAPTLHAQITAGPVTNSANGHIYYLVGPTNWAAAEAQAVSMGGHLTTINDAAENAWIATTFANGSPETRGLWTGLTDAAQEGTFVWINGETATYRNWAAGEPNNGGGYFTNEDNSLLVVGGSAFPFGTWPDSPEWQIWEGVVEIGPPAPPPPPTTIDQLIVAGPVTNLANAHVYYLVAPTNWAAAQAEALSLGGYLTTINDAAENYWIANTFGTSNGPTRGLWTGLTDAQQEGAFVWINGETATYRNWAAGEPNNGGGYFENEDNSLLVVGGTAFPFGTWPDSPGFQIWEGVVEIGVPDAPTPPPLIVAGPVTNYANGHVYLLLSATNWAAAEAEAVSLGGHLAAINDAQENNWIATTFANGSGVTRGLWTGLTDAGQEGTFAWINGEPVTYQNWAAGEPNNGGGYFTNEDNSLLVVGGSAFPFGTWVDSPDFQIWEGLVELGTTGPRQVAATIRVSQLVICWDSITGSVYQVQYLTTNGVWTNLTDFLPGIGAQMCVTDDTVGSQQRYYRVLAQ